MTMEKAHATLRYRCSAGCGAETTISVTWKDGKVTRRCDACGAVARPRGERASFDGSR